MRKVAVITRTKDRPEFLKRAIDSVASQTYSDYLHVIVNDGGDKDSVDSLVLSFNEKVRNNIRVYHRKVSSDAPDTIFNEAIAYENSEYIAIHDDDDSWHVNFLASTLELLNSGANGVVVRTDKIIEEVSGIGDIVIKKKSQYLPHIRAISLYQQCDENQLTPISFIYRRSVYDDIGGYDDGLPVAGDWEFGLRFLQKYDVEYLDPGFALANYHHRKKGKLANASTFQKHNHRKYFNLIANRYLRQELEDGRLGVGYIMSSIRYNQGYSARLVGKILPRGVVSRFKRRMGE